MPDKKAKVIPAWAERLVVAAIENYVDPEVIAATVAGWRDQVLAKMVAAAKETDNKVDDKIVALVKDALTTCSPEAKFLCDMIMNAEAFAVGVLENAAKATDTKIDDACVAVVKKALLG